MTYFFLFYSTILPHTDNVLIYINCVLQLTLQNQGCTVPYSMFLILQL